MHSALPSTKPNAYPTLHISFKEVWELVFDLKEDMLLVIATFRIGVLRFGPNPASNWSFLLKHTLEGSR